MNITNDASQLSTPITYSSLCTTILKLPVNVKVQPLDKHQL